MPDMFFLSASGPDPVGSLRASLGTERVLWSGHCAVAEYAFEEPASLPRWTLPEETEVFVTETRVAFVDPSGEAGGELHWPWPQHLRVQPGNRDTGRSATVTQIQLVCAGPADTFPALVFAGGDLSTVGDADRLANVLRQSIARFRVEFATDLGLTTAQARMLSRLVIGPEFSNYQGGEGQTVSLLGGMAVDQPVVEAEPVAAEPVWEPEPFLDDYLRPHGYQQAGYEPHPYHSDAPAGWDDGAGPGYPASAEPSRAAQPQYIEAQYIEAQYTEPRYIEPQYREPEYREPEYAEAQHTEPQYPEVQYTDLASRAADLAARVASLVSANAGVEQSLERYETQTTNLSAFLTTDDGPADGYSREGEDRAETVRRTAARFAGNSARARTTGQRPAGDEYGARQHHP